MFQTRSILNYNHLPLKRCKKDVYTFDHRTNNSKLCIIYGREMKEIQRWLAGFIGTTLLDSTPLQVFVIYCTRKNEKTLKFDLIPKSCFVKFIVFLLFFVFYDAWLVGWFHWDRTERKYLPSIYVSRNINLYIYKVKILHWKKRIVEKKKRKVSQLIDLFAVLAMWFCLTDRQMALE